MPLSAADRRPPSDWREDLAIAGERVNAWWEGFDFDPRTARDQQRARLAIRRLGPLAKAAPEVLVSIALWGEGRTDPGEPAWTMRHARALGLPVRAKIAVFGAGAGAPLTDLKAAAQWRATGFTRHPVARGRERLVRYDAPSGRPPRGSLDGALCFFELHREADASSHIRLAADLMRPNGSAAFVDFVGARPGLRLRACFDDAFPGTLLSLDQLSECLQQNSFRVSESVDETRLFQGLVSRGFSRWRSAYAIAMAQSRGRRRAEFTRAFARLSHLWAERFDAMRAGQLQVKRILVRRT